MNLEIRVVAEYPGTTTESMTTSRTQETTTEALKTTEETTTKDGWDSTTSEPFIEESPWGPRNVTFEFPEAWELLGTWSGPDE